MMKYENVAQVGDTIRALDFPQFDGRPDSYLIGEVIEKGPVYRGDVHMYDGYTVRVTESVTGSEEYDAERRGLIMTVPFEFMMNDFENRVENLTSEYELFNIDEQFEELEAMMRIV